MCPYYDCAAVYGVWPYPGYPPICFPPPPGYGVPVLGLAFGIGFAIVPTLWGWDHWDWEHHRLQIDRDRFNRLDQGHPPIAGDTWQHDASRRGAVPSRDPAARARAQAALPGSVDARRAYRGFPEGAGAPGSPGCAFGRDPAPGFYCRTDGAGAGSPGSAPGEVQRPAFPAAPTARAPAAPAPRPGRGPAPGCSAAPAARPVTVQRPGFYRRSGGAGAGARIPAGRKRRRGARPSGARTGEPASRGPAAAARAAAACTGGPSERTGGRRRSTPAMNRTLYFAFAIALALWLFPVTEGLAAAAKQQSFASPEQAVTALVAAVRANNRDALLEIFGPAGKDLIFSGDAVADRNGRAHFLAAYAAMNRIDKAGATATLVIGPDAWPFPIPLAQRGKNWRFDTEAGREQILDRRIGRNELAAIEVCRAFVDAQREYATKDRNGNGILEYAQHFMSSPGQHDGLYWPAASGEEQSPMGELVAQARAQGYEGRRGGKSRALSRLLLPDPDRPGTERARRRLRVYRQRPI